MSLHTHTVQCHCFGCKQKLPEIPAPKNKQQKRLNLNYDPKMCCRSDLVFTFMNQTSPVTGKKKKKSPLVYIKTVALTAGDCPKWWVPVWGGRDKRPIRALRLEDLLMMIKWDVMLSCFGKNKTRHCDVMSSKHVIIVVFKLYFNIYCTDLTEPIGNVSYYNIIFIIPPRALIKDMIMEGKRKTKLEFLIYYWTSCYYIMI